MLKYINMRYIAPIILYSVYLCCFLIIITPQWFFGPNIDKSFAILSGLLFITIFIITIIEVVFFIFRKNKTKINIAFIIIEFIMLIVVLKTYRLM